ncbi:MAG: ABC transporter ATP-binding protein, partial [Actinomycetota bacterium]|nr:ABC transporter ATP-binding protein [Actinomycetota bacterium]
YMDEAQVLADEVAIIARGEIVAHGPPGSLGGRDTASTILRFRLPDGAGELPPSIRGGAAVGGTVAATTDDPTRALHELTGWAMERGFRLDDIEVSRPTLEDVYLQLTGGEAGTEG